MKTLILLAALAASPEITWDYMPPRGIAYYPTNSVQFIYDGKLACEFKLNTMLPAMTALEFLSLASFFHANRADAGEAVRRICSFAKDRQP